MGARIRMAKGLIYGKYVSFNGELITLRDGQTECRVRIGHERQCEEQDRAFPVCNHLRVLAEGQRYRLGCIHRRWHHQPKFRPCPFSAGNIPGHSSPDQLRQSAQPQDLPAGIGRPWHLQARGRHPEIPAHQRLGYLHQPAPGGAQAQRQGAVLAVETAQGLPADHRRARADPWRGRGLAAQPVGGAAPVSPPGPLRPGPAGTPRPPGRGPG